MPALRRSKRQKSFLEAVQYPGDLNGVFLSAVRTLNIIRPLATDCSRSYWFPQNLSLAPVVRQVQVSLRAGGAILGARQKQCLREMTEVFNRFSSPHTLPKLSRSI